ncbi:MAG: sigma factor [Propionibacteriaceae bacterium]|nr:sigma factor [Propionibacteriaceae bacterium]
MNISRTHFTAPLIDLAEEVELFRTIEAATYAAHLLETGSGSWDSADLQAMVEAGLQARHRLFTANLRLVMKIAAAEARLSGIELEELFQEGCLALGEAIPRFDQRRGTRFSTLIHRYVTRAVRQRSLHGRISMELVRHHSGRREQVRWTSLERLPQEYTATDGGMEEVERPCWELLDLLGQAGWVLRKRYGIGTRPTTRTVLSRTLGVSPSTVRRLEETGIQAAKELLEGEQCRTPKLPQVA